MIIWIDGTFGIGKTAAANELLNKLPESEVIDFDEFIKSVRIENQMEILFGRRYPEANKSYVNALADCLNNKIRTNPSRNIIVPIALITDYCRDNLVETINNKAETIHFILFSSKEKMLERIEKQGGRDLDLAITYYDEATSYLQTNYKDAIRINTEKMTIKEVVSCLEEFIADGR